MASSTTGAVLRKAAKDLACADCQRRKKRCDKQSPCSNCVKHNVPCIPSSPAPPRKRRQPMKELLERLAACEERLKYCNCHQSQLSPPPPLLQRPHSHEHPHGAPPSPPASAASRDAAIANMLDHSGREEENIKDKFHHTPTMTGSYVEYAPPAPVPVPAMTATTTAAHNNNHHNHNHNHNHTQTSGT